MAKEQISLTIAKSPTGSQEHVCMIVNGKLTADFPPEVARQLAKGLMHQAAKIENNQNPDKQIYDQAILMRAGIPIGLNDNKKLLNEAHKEAQWNRDLRRYMTKAPGISSKEVFGTPTIIQTTIKGE